LNKLRE